MPLTKAVLVNGFQGAGGEYWICGDCISAATVNFDFSKHFGFAERDQRCYWCGGYRDTLRRAIRKVVESKL